MIDLLSLSAGWFVMQAGEARAMQASSEPTYLNAPILQTQEYECGLM